MFRLTIMWMASMDTPMDSWEPVNLPVMKAALPSPSFPLSIFELEPRALEAKETRAGFPLPPPASIQMAEVRGTRTH